MALIGYWLFNEALPPQKVVSISLIVIGVIGLNLGQSAA
jgi:multidrug transporter EmrE-like cation transporter